MIRMENVQRNGWETYLETDGKRTGKADMWCLLYMQKDGVVLWFSDVGEEGGLLW